MPGASQFRVTVLQPQRRWWKVREHFVNLTVELLQYLALLWKGKVKGIIETRAQNQAQSVCAARGLSLQTWEECTLSCRERWETHFLT